MGKLIAAAALVAAAGVAAYLANLGWVERHAEKERAWMERHDVRQADKERCREDHRHFCWLPLAR